MGPGLIMLQAQVYGAFGINQINTHVVSVRVIHNSVMQRFNLYFNPNQIIELLSTVLPIALASVLYPFTAPPRQSCVPPS